MHMKVLLKLCHIGYSSIPGMFEHAPRCSCRVTRCPISLCGTVASQGAPHADLDLSDTRSRAAAVLTGYSQNGRCCFCARREFNIIVMRSLATSRRSVSMTTACSPLIALRMWSWHGTDWRAFSFSSHLTLRDANVVFSPSRSSSRLLFANNLVALPKGLFAPLTELTTL